MQLAQCLKCGRPGVDNMDTRHDPHTGWIKRRKRCKACGHKWTSWEMPAATLDALRGGIDAARALFAGLGDLQKTLREAIAAADRLPDGFGDSGHVVEPLVPYEAAWPVPAVTGAAQWLRGERNIPPSTCGTPAQWLRSRERKRPPPSPYTPYDDPLVPYIDPLWQCDGCGTEVRRMQSPREDCKGCGSSTSWRQVKWWATPAPAPDSPEWPAHVASICRWFGCDGQCGEPGKEHRDLCLRVATLGRMPTSEER